jgi:glycosyltransferase involved in cell wall biosynthesis
MRIAVNTRFLLPDRLEGIGWFTYEVVRRLVDRRPEDEFIFLFDRPFDPAFVFADNVKPVVVPPPARHPLLWYLWFEWSVPWVLRRKQADVFFSPDGYCSLRSKVPTVMVTHDIAHEHYPEQVPPLVRRYYQHFVPRYIQRADQVVTVSQATAKDIQAHYGTPAQKLHPACNGVRSVFRPLSEEEKTRTRQAFAEGQEYFFYLGAVHPRKNLARLIAAYDQFRKRTSAPVKLLIGGRFAWQTGEVDAAYRQAEYRDDIVFLGYLDGADLPRLVGAALALTYVSLFEGFGVPVLEAMHCDVPIITSNVSSLPEVAGEAALLVDPTDVSAIAQAMERVQKDESLRTALVAKGGQQRERFSWELATDVVEQALYSSHDSKS